jgi:hypothetical protein
MEREEGSSRREGMETVLNIFITSIQGAYTATIE